MVLDQLPFAVLVVDENYNFIYSNQNFHELFTEPSKGQESLKEIIPRQFIQEGKVFEVLTLLKDMNQPQKMVKIPKFRLRMENEDDLYFNLMILPIKVNGIFHFMFIFHDITEDQEEEISSFQQAKLMALGEMAAAIAHEINNFLSILQGHIDLADMKNKDEAVRQHLQFIRTQIDNIANFSKSILNFSRQNTVDFVELSMNQVVKETMRFLEARMRKNNIRIVLNLDPEVAPIKGNPSQLQQLLINLLLNAKKAIKDQGKIVITTRKDPGKTILEIEDNGVGMTRAVASRIFNPFFTTRADGHGLGLNICEKIVTNHNGMIDFVSKRNKGTKFTIIFPSIN